MDKVDFSFDNIVFALFIISSLPCLRVIEPFLRVFWIGSMLEVALPSDNPSLPSSTSFGLLRLPDRLGGLERAERTSEHF